ncbi:MAG: FemAB family PEP-CTERM system-associated protein [Gammaproteobacteria bacterium]|nr:FemAB family PEP-CTERM system-associated protein [Gammaproteobacteria bacterium]
MELTISSPAPIDRAEWNSFVLAQPQGTHFHRAEWADVIERVFGHRCHHLVARAGGAIAGVLPLVEVRSRLFGHSLSSTPFCVYGGAIGSDEAILALEDAAARLAEKLGVSHLELRNRDRERPGWLRKDLYATFRKPLAADDDANLNAIPRKQRAMVRKGIGNDLSSVTERTIDQFFPIYASSVRDLGTPVFPRRYFRALLEAFGDDCDVLTVRDRDGQPIASVLSFYFRDEVLPYYAGGLHAARELKGYDFMYWELMRGATARGCRWFDYGRSKQGTGAYSFKKNWGFEPAPLPYQYHLVKAQALPDVSPANPKYRLFIAAWQRLPLPVANRIGPLLSRSLG